MIDWLMDVGIINLLNCIFQGIIATAAVVAIWITIKQISGKASIHLKMKTEFRLNEATGGNLTVELVIHMVNLGMAPVYVSSSGIQLWKRNKQKLKMRISNETFVLQSGEMRTVSGQYMSEMMDDRASLHDKIRIYAECQMDKVFYDRKKYPYDEFQHEFEKKRKRIDKLD